MYPLFSVLEGRGEEEAAQGHRAGQESEPCTPEGGGQEGAEDFEFL